MQRHQYQVGKQLALKTGFDDCRPTQCSSVVTGQDGEGWIMNDDVRCGQIGDLKLFVQVRVRRGLVIQQRINVLGNHKFA